MSQVIYRSQIKKYQNAPGPLPEKETEEQKKKRLEEEAKKKAAASEENKTQVTPTQSGTITPATKPATTSTAPADPAESALVFNGFFEQNGVRVTGNRAIQEINKKFKNILNKRAQTDALNAINNGGGVRVLGNKVWFFDKDGNDITHSIITPKTFPKTRFGRNWAATWSTQKDADLDSYNALISGEITPDAPEKEPGPVKKSLLRGSGWFSYDKDKDGKSIYNKGAQSNQQMYDTMRDAVGAIWADDFNKDNYNDADKWNFDYIRALKDNFNGTEGFNNYLIDLENRLAAGEEVKDNDKRILKLFGYEPDATGTESGSSSGTGSTTKEYWTPDAFKGNADAYKKAGLTFTKGENGEYTLTGGIFGNGDVDWALFGNNLFKGTQYENGFYHKGRLYTRDEVAADDALGTIFRPFLTASANGANWNTTYDNMNASGVRFQGDRIWAGKDNKYYGGYTMYDPESVYAREYDSEFRKKNGLAGKGVKDITGEYNLGAGKKLFAYTDGQTNYGEPIIRYMMFDNGAVTKLNNLDAYASARKQAAYQTATPIDWGEIDANGYAPYKEFTTQAPGKARQNNALMYNPTTGRYSIITNYDPNAQGAKGYDIDQSWKDYILENIKNGIWNIDFNGQLSQFGKRRVDPQTRANNPESRGREAISGLAFKKQGGKIDWNRLQKLQTGGTFAGPVAKAKITKTSDLKHDISKAHTMDEGLTESEKLRIGAAITDLGGTIVSLIPGASTAGAVTGALATTAQLRADRLAQKEGRDVGNYWGRAIANYAMDALTAAPIAGAAAKIFKVGKGLQKIAPLLGKAMRFAAPVLGAAGLANAQAALDKIVKGEWSKLTSNDLTDLFNGLSAATGGGAVVRQGIKDARAITNLADTAQTAAKDAKAIKNGKVGDVLFDKKTGEILETLDKTKTKKEALSKIKDMVKEQNSALDGEALDKAAQDVFDALGLKETAGKKHWKRNGFLNWSREAGDARFELGDSLKLPENTSIWSEMLNPKKVWMRDENLARAVSGLSAEEINAANKAVRTRQYNPNSETSSMDLFDWLRARDTAQAISRMTVNNPQVFTNATFGNAPVQDRRRWLGPLTANAFGPRGYRMVTPVTPAATTPAPVVPDSRLSAKRLIDFRNDLIARQASSYPADASSARYSLENIFAQPEAKKFMQEHPEAAANAIRRIIAQWYGKGTPLYTGTTYLLNNSTTGEIGNFMRGKGIKFKQGGEIPKFQDGGENIHERGKKPKFNIPGMMDLTSAIVQSTAIGKAYDDKREAIKLAGLATKTSPRIQGTRFDVSPIDRQVNEAVEPYRQVQFNSSDNRENMAGELQRAKAISDIHERAGEQKTQAINQFNATEVQRANAQASQDAEVADVNRALSAQVAASLKEADAAERNEKWAQVWNTYSKQFRQNARDLQNKKAQSQYESDLQDAENEYNDAIKMEFAGLRGEYENDPNKGSMSFESWVAADANRLNRYNKIKEGNGVRAATDRYRNKRLGLQNNYYSTIYGPIVRYKSGGKVEKTVSKKQKLDVNDRLVLQGDKAAKRAVLQTSNNLHKMLMKLMK